MMMGAVPTSVPQLILTGNWLAEGNFKWKWDQIKTNKLFWILSSVFLIHVLGLSYTQNLDAGLKDILIKIPLMFLPLVFFTAKPLSKGELNGALYCFIVGCITNTLWCLTYSFVLHQNEVVRNASRFMSHIRLGLYLNVAITICVYFAVKAQGLLKKGLFILLSVYFIFVLFILGLGSGVVNFVLLFFLAMCVFIYRQKTSFKIAGIFILVGFITVVAFYVFSVWKSQLSVKLTKNNSEQKQSSSGRPYLHFENKGQKENGNYVQLNIQPDELKNEWNKRMPADSFDYFSQHNIQRYNVIIRYLSSKGLNKDSFGIAQLTEKDLINISKGISNFEYDDWSFLHKRTYELVNEYDEFKNNRRINGHSLTMRLYFWDAALHLIKQHYLFGVGTGDVQQELNKTYVETHSPLEAEWYKRPHNQFLTTMVAFGIIGLLVFILSIVYPAVSLRKQLQKVYWPFLIVAVLSFLMEDTLETQAGCTFYSYFTALFVSSGYFEKHHSGHEN